ncbi:hypothetical protein X766_33245 [Mesorhizobium sp. LSJC255A00]|nr:hypothetical protein X766_33245 [Mesorhizobium sp. LSJC255A00]
MLDRLHAERGSNVAFLFRACRRAAMELGSGDSTRSRLPTKTDILNLLHRLIDGKSLSASVVDAAQALSWPRSRRPMSSAYDALRQAKEVRHAS